MQIDRIDHVILTVRDLDAMVAFYDRVLGLKTVPSCARGKALRLPHQTIVLREGGPGCEPPVPNSSPGVAEICLITPLSLGSVIDSLAARGVELVAGPVEGPGTEGPLLSVSVRDPDGNLITLANRPISGRESVIHLTRRGL